MEIVPYELRAGQLNQTYEKILNCRKVKPPYDKAGFYSAEFFLDKRNGLTSVCTDPTINVLDDIEIQGNRYYYYRIGTDAYVGVVNTLWAMVALTPAFPIDDNSPRRIAYGRNVYGPKNSSGRVIDPSSGTGGNLTVGWMDNYSGGYVKLKYTGTSGIEIGDYLVFTGETSVLKGGLNKVEDADYATVFTNYTTPDVHVSISPSKALFVTVGGWVSIIPGPGSPTPSGQTAHVNAVNMETGIVTLDTAVISSIGDKFVYGEYIYIIGTNDRGSVPKAYDTFDVYKKDTSTESNAIMVGHNNSAGKGVVSMLLMNGTYAANVVQVLVSDNKIIDIVNFDQNLFVLTEKRMYFSRSTIDDNTQFYPLDSFSVDKGEKMFPVGKAMILFARTNKLFAPVNSNNVNVGYVGYWINYAGKLHSKYAQTFSDQTYYVLQKDLQLMQVDIVSNNGSTFDIATKNILLNTRGIFEDIGDSPVYVSNDTKYLNFTIVKDGKTIVKQFDKSYQDWMIQEYEWLTINKFGTKVLMDGYVAEIWTWFQDFGEPYRQEVNFALNSGMNLSMPVIIRTIFGLVPNRFDVTNDMEFDIAAKTDYKKVILNGFDFDNRLSPTLTGDEMIPSPSPEEVATYNWTTVSIQYSVLHTWRYARFNYNGYDRFCIGDTYIFKDMMKPFVNEQNKGA